MAETKKVRMKVSRGVPGRGIVRVGGVVEISSFWADKYIADGSAEEVRAGTRAKGKENGGSEKSKN